MVLWFDCPGSILFSAAMHDVWRCGKIVVGRNPDKLFIRQKSIDKIARVARAPKVDKSLDRF